MRKIFALFLIPIIAAVAIADPTSHFNIGLFGNGTVGGPSIGWNSDADGAGTGFYRPSANVIGFAINGVDLYRANSTGFHLGAGTGDMRLSVDAGGADTTTTNIADFYANSSFSASGGFVFSARRDNATPTNRYAIINSSDSGGTARYLILNNNGANVGVAMTNPARALDVTGSFGATGAATLGSTLNVTGITTLTAQPILSSLTASLPVFTDASKGLISNTMTGTGSVVMSASPTLTGIIAGANETLSGTLAVTGNVGIGTAATARNLQVAGVTPLLWLNDTTSNLGIAELAASSTEVRLASTTGNAYLPLNFYTNGTKQLAIDTAGVATFTGSLTSTESGNSQFNATPGTTTSVAATTYQNNTSKTLVVGLDSNGGGVSGTAYAALFRSSATSPMLIQTTASQPINLYTNSTVALGLGSDHSLTQTTGTAVTGTCTNSASGTAVTGSGTQFLTEFRIGDTITMNAETRTIATITSDTALTTDAWTGANAGATATRAATPYFYTYPNGNIQTGGTRTTQTQFGAQTIMAVNTSPGTGSTSNLPASIGAISYSGAATAANGNAQLNLVRAHGTEGSMSALLSGDRVGGVIWRGATTSALFGIGARMDATATENWASGSQGMKILFQTVPNTTTTATTALTLDQDQSIVIPKIVGIDGGGVLAGTAINIEGSGAQGGGTSQNGIRIANTADSTVATKGLLVSLTQKASTTVTNAKLIDIEDTTLGASAAITNQIGMFISDLTTGGTLNYGIQSAVTSGTGKANIFASGTADNMLRGNVRIGSTTAPTVALDVTGGINADGAIVFSNASVKMTGITTGTNADTVCLKSDGTLLIQAAACTISKRALKEDIDSVDGDEALRVIMALNPVEFNFRHVGKENSDPNYYHRQAGFIAEEVADVDPSLAVYEADMKTPKSYRENAMISKLVKVVQMQQKRIEKLEKRLGY